MATMWLRWKSEGVRVLSFITYNINKKTGIKYAYQARSYRDPETGKPKFERHCIGHVDPVTNKIVPNKKREKIENTDIEQSIIEPSICNKVNLNQNIEIIGKQTIEKEIITTSTIVGPELVLTKISKELKLTDILKKCFPKTYTFILSIIFYIVQKGTPLYRIETWSQSHTHPYNSIINSQRLSEFLVNLDTDDIQKFLSLWLNNISENEALCYDITSISSYSKNNEYLKWGYNRDRDKLPQINLALLYGKKTNLPAFYRRIAGNITDVKTLKNTIKHLDYLGINHITYIIDRGFYSKDNITTLLSTHSNFILSLPSHRLWIETILDKYYESIKLPENSRQISEDETIFAVRHIYYWQNPKRRVYLYIFYQPKKEFATYEDFLKNLIFLKKQIEINDIDKKLFDSLSRYLIINEKSVKFNNDEIQKYRKKYCGFFCMLSTKKFDSLDVLSIYRQRNIVENSFDDLKNELDAKRLRIHTSKAMDSRFFLQFLALILATKIRTMKNSNFKLKYLTLREFFDELDILSKITVKHRYNYVGTELNKNQQNIIEYFNLPLT
jgi:transposase